MYEKHNWVNGEVITEDKLNHMEEGISTGGGIYSYNETVLFDGSVTTVKESEDYPAGVIITLQGDAPKHDISVSFNGQNYVLPYGYYKDAPGDYWGEFGEENPIFENYPLFISTTEGGYGVATPEAGTYTLKIIGNGFELNNDFKNSFPKTLFVSVIPGESGTGKLTLDKTYSEINSAILNGDNVKFFLHGDDIPTKEYYFDSIRFNNNWTLQLFTLTSYGNTAAFKSFEFSFTNSEGYPCNYDTSGGEV